MMHDAIRAYLRRGWAVTPLGHRSKRAILPGWDKQALTEADIPTHWTNGQNVGLVLGLSRLVDVDLDDDRAVQLAPRFLPPTDMIGGHDGRPRSHWYYRSDATHEVFAPPGGGKPLVELRAGAHQTVIAPSVHPEGHVYRWYGPDGSPIDRPGVPAEVPAGELRAAVARLAAAVLLATHWPVGQRHQAALAVAGALRRAGWSLEDARHFVESVASAADDSEIADRMRAVEDTYACAGAEPTTGLARLKTLIGANIAERVAEWLDLRPEPVAAKPKTPATRLAPVPPYEPFPLDVLPGPWREFCRAGAELLNVDLAMTALPALAVVAGAIGMTRQIRLGHDWFEPAVLWTCVVADSGSRKSGAAELSVKLALDAQLKLTQKYKLELQDYVEETRRRKAEKQDVTTLEPPVHRRLVVSDATLEKVIAILDENPRGLLLYRDELRGWFGSFQKYRQAGAGSDEPAWLSMHGARTLVYDRKTGIKTSVIVPCAAVSVTGTIQPGVLRTVLTEQAFGSGLAARVVFAQPPKHPKRFVDRGIPDELRQQCVASLAKLYDLAAQGDSDGVLRPMTVGLSKEAQARWRRFVDEFGERQYMADGEEAAVLSKAEGLAGRFALIHHLVEAAPFDDLQPVELRSVEAGIRFAEWAAVENLRVYRLVQEDREAASLRELAEAVRRLADRLGGTVSGRDLARARKSRFPTPADAELALETLVNVGIGEWVESSSTGQRGRPAARRFRPDPLIDDGDKNDKNDKNPLRGESDDGGGTTKIPDPPPDGPQHPPSGNCASAGQKTGCGNPTDPSKGFLSFSSFLSYGRNGCDAGTATSEPKPPAGIFVVTSLDRLAEVRRHFEACTTVGIDLETTGLNPRTDRVRLLTLSVNGRTCVIDCFAVDPAPLFPILAEKELVGHNLAFDLGFLDRLRFAPGAVWDSMLAAQVLDAGLSVKHSLQDVAKRYLNLELDKTEQTADWSGPLTEAMLRYAALDAEVPLKLREVMLPQLRAARLEKVLDLEHRCLPAVVSMLANGVGFDADRWVRLAEEAEARRQELEVEMNALVPSGNHLFGPGCNWNSPEQVKQSFASLGVHLDGTADEVLAAIDHPLAALLREYRGLAKRTGTYGPEWLRHVENGRVYPQWRQCSTATGRMSCSNPNMQQLPRDTRYRQCFVARPGCVLIKADYSQIELRLAAKIADEERMIEAYQRGEDLHTQTARVILGKNEITKADRQLAKALNFGLLYGMGAGTFAEYAKLNYGVTLTKEEAQRYREKFFEAYPGLKRWHRRQGGRTNGQAVETRTLMGRRRLNVARYTEKLNTPVQGSGADGLKAALALLWERRHECPSARVVLAVHDELVVEAPLDATEKAKEWLVRCMVDGMRPLLDPVPVVVEATMAPTWGG